MTTQTEALKLAYDETWNAGSEYPIPSFDDVISFANKLKFLKENLVLSEKELCPSCRNSDIYACTCTFNPPQRTAAEGEDTKAWVGLTDEEMWQLVNDCTFGGDLHVDKFIRAIKAKLKEKNT